MKLHLKAISILLLTFTIICLAASCTKDLEKIEGPYLIPVLITDDDAQYRFEYNTDYALARYVKISALDGAIEENTIEYDVNGRISKRQSLLINGDEETTKTYTYTYSGNTIYESDEEERVDTLTINNYDLMRYARFSPYENSGYNEVLEYTNNYRLTKISSDEFYTEDDVKKQKLETRTFEFDEKRAPYYHLNTPRWFVINKLPYGKYWSASSVVKIEKETVYKLNGEQIAEHKGTIEMSYTYNNADDPETIVWSEGNDSKTIKIAYKDINDIWQQSAE